MEFLRTHDLKEFKARVQECSFFTDEECEKIDNEGSQENYPWLSRNVAAEILDWVFTKNVRKLVDNSEFAVDSLFCEYAYVVDLDASILEVYKGFNTVPLESKERFFGTGKSDGEYYPIRLWKVFDIKRLPSNAEFLDQLKEDEETDEE